MRIIRAILAGERDLKNWLNFGIPIYGNWRREHLFSLQQAGVIFTKIR